MCMPVYFQGYKHSALYNILFALVARDRSTEALFVSNRYHKGKYTGVFMVWLYEIWSCVGIYFGHIFNMKTQT